MSRAALLLLLLAGPALARVGGGESYSGGDGSSGGGGGGGGGDADLIFFLIRLCFEYPKVGVPLLLIVVSVVGYHHWTKGSLRLDARRTIAPRGASPTARSWDLLRRHDPDFSRPVLMDFLLRLVMRHQALEVEGDPEALRPYLAEPVLERLRATNASNRAAKRKLVDVVIGGLDVSMILAQGDGSAALTVDVELNYGVEQGGKAAHYYVRQTWRLDRARGARSPRPDVARALGCPNCGAPVTYSREGRCPHCDTVVVPGALTWRVSGIAVVDRRPRHDYNPSLGGGDEEGTELPDVRDPRLDAALAELRQRDPGFDPARFGAFARDVFLRLQAAWDAGSWEQARPYESDLLYQSHRFHLENLARRGLRNRVEGVQVSSVRLVRAEADRHYDALTVRIFASARDHTLDRRGQVVSGSATRPRRFSEYWTFVRAAGFEAKAEQDPQSCPNCGAPVQVNQAGDCAHCGSTVTTGRFGWVLSAIEQDEAYRG